MTKLLRVFAATLALCALLGASSTAEELAPAFDAALAALVTPAQAALESGEYELRTGDTAYVPDVSPGIIPFDEREQTAPSAAGASFKSDDPSVVSVDENGLMTALKPGMTVVTYSAAGSESYYLVTVSDEAMPEVIKNYVYVLNREFLTVRRARLPKYNQYAKWYYKKKKEVGWCSVFTIYCANAAGYDPIDEDDVDPQNPPAVQFLREGQVGNQYDGFMKAGRFGGVPRPGYLVIYADLDNAYRTTHIASITDVRERGDEVYELTTVEGNMSNSVKSYRYLYDSKADNHLVGAEKGLKLQGNMSELPADEQTDPLVQYALHTDHWAVFGFCETWK